MQPRDALAARSMPSKRPLLVLALGGNAITRVGDDASVAAQFGRTEETARLLLPVIASGGWRIVITHGNGPQIGSILLRSDFAAEAGELPRLPMDIAVADTQGGMGYMIQQCLGNALWEADLALPVATVITQVIVDEEDEAFADPSKPVGRFYPEERVAELRRHGWVMKKDPQDRGWRRVVPSPEPKEIVEESVVRELCDAGAVVIACGGGGIPVAPGTGGHLSGIEAVIDKDLASSLLASGLKADTFAVLTEVDRVYLDYGKPGQRPLDRAHPSALEKLAAEGHFPAGSMGPKIAAAVRFLQKGGSRAIITNPERIEAALAGSAGTHISSSFGVSNRTA